MHGANRLASNSLLEGLVFGDRAVEPSVAHIEHCKKNCSRQLHHAAASADFSDYKVTKGHLIKEHQDLIIEKRQQLQSIMWQYCGIIRNINDLEIAKNKIKSIYQDVLLIKKNIGICIDSIELLNLVNLN